MREHTPLAKPGFCGGRKISCQPNTGALLGTRTNSDNYSKRIGAGMEILALPLAVIIVTFIVQLVKNVTMIATMVLITIM